MTLRLLPTHAAVLGRETDGIVPREWSRAERLGVQGGPENQFDRMGLHVQTVLGSGSTAYGTATTSPDRILTPEQARLIYQRTPDVRSAIDGIVRRVSTTDWKIEPSEEECDPAHPRYDEANEESAAIRRWLKKPTDDADLFQTEMTKTLTDLLIWDAGAFELVPNSRRPKVVQELVSIRGADIHPHVDSKGRLIEYVQEPRTAITGVSSKVRFGKEQILYLRLFPNNEGPEGLSLLESLIYEVAAILRAAEHISSSLNLNELPPGLLVVAGIAKTAQDRFSADFEAKRGEDWRLRPVFSEREGVVDAKWIELKRAPRDLQINELATEIRRTIWRVFGVMPVEQGDTGDMPRATATIQLDVGSSHLLTPILDLVEATLSARVIPRRVVDDPELGELLSFKWKRTRDLTPEEQQQRAEALAKLVQEGILSTNEVRHVLGQQPREEGDVLRVGTVTLASIVEPDEVDGTEAEGSDEARDDEDADPEDPKDEEDPKDDEGDEEVDDEEEAPKAKGRRSPRSQVRRPRAVRRHRHRHPEVRAADVMPSEWQSPGTFDDTRTLDLQGLWDDVALYGAQVTAVWEEARSVAVSIVSAHYRDRGFDAAARQEVSRQLNERIDQLFVAWSVDTLPRYEGVAAMAARQAGKFTGTIPDLQPSRSRAQVYHRTAMGYLVDSDGLLTDLRSDLAAILVAVTDIRGTAPPPTREVLQRAPLLSPEAETEAVLLAVAAAFDSQRHRITNWSGKLLDLAYGVLVEETEAAATSGRAEGISKPEPGDPVEWWCEWIAVGDQSTCDTCRTEAGKGFQRLANLQVRPGAGTRCRANCRCVLTLWTKAEIDGGRAESLNP